MFTFLRRRREARAALDAAESLFKKVLDDFENGGRNSLEAALVLQIGQRSLESLTRLVSTFASAEIYTINKGVERFSDAAITEGPEAKPYVAVFTSRERAEVAAAEWAGFPRVSSVDPLELLFALGEDAGIALNPKSDALCWHFTPEQVTEMRTMFERAFNYEAGGIYTVWTDGSYRAAKLLLADDRGVHIRLYANTWIERPLEVDAGTLTLSGSMQAMGHLPIVRSNFLSMGPNLVSKTAVSEDELEGYRIWEEANGGYFG